MQPMLCPCRPANSALVTAASSGIDLPASLQGQAEEVSEHFYLATMREPNAGQPMASMQRRGSVSSHPWQEEQNQDLPAVQQSLVEPEPFTAVNLGPLLGSGGSGHVYRGTWNGATVAVKVSIAARCVATQDACDKSAALASRVCVWTVLLQQSQVHMCCLSAVVFGQCERAPCTCLVTFRQNCA